MNRKVVCLPSGGKFQLDTELDNSDVKYIRNACYPRISMEKKEIDKIKWIYILI